MKTQLISLRQYSSAGRGRKFLKPAIALAFLIGAMACGNAWARPGGGGGHGHGGWHGGAHGHWHGHAHAGLVIGAPLWWGAYGYRYGPGWYGDPFDDYPYSASLLESQPPAQPWYYCVNPQGDYPYVKNCATGWRSVVGQGASNAAYPPPDTPAPAER